MATKAEKEAEKKAKADAKAAAEVKPEATATEKAAKAEKIAEGETPGGLPSAAAIAADAESKKTGENTDGVLSPDPIVGEKVPSDFVPPGAEVNPKTGAVILEGTTNANSATPRPNPPEGIASKRAPEGKEWAGNHTI